MRRRMPSACSRAALRRAASASARRDAASATERLARAAGHGFRQQRQRADHHRADQHGEAHPGMEQEADRDVERHPGQIEKSRQPGARHERAHVVEVAHGLQAVAGGAAAQRQPRDDVEHARRQSLIEPAPDPHQDASAQHVEQPLEAEQHEREQREAEQRRHAAARQHAVVDLQHEDRPGQHEQIDQAARHRDADEGIAVGGDGRPQLAARHRGVGPDRADRQQALPGGGEGERKRTRGGGPSRGRDPIGGWGPAKGSEPTRGREPSGSRPSRVVVHHGCTLGLQNGPLPLDRRVEHDVGAVDRCCCRRRRRRRSDRRRPGRCRQRPRTPATGPSRHRRGCPRCHRCRRPRPPANRARCRRATGTGTNPHWCRHWHRPATVLGAGRRRRRPMRRTNRGSAPSQVGADPVARRLRTDVGIDDVVRLRRVAVAGGVQIDQPLRLIGSGTGLDQARRRRIVAAHDIAADERRHRPAALRPACLPRARRRRRCR